MDSSSLHMFLTVFSWLVVAVRFALCADADVQWYLVKKGNKMACVRSGDLAAMFWKGPADHAGIRMTSQFVEKDFDSYQCEPRHCPRWTVTRFLTHEGRSINNMSDPVFDVRWDGLVEIVTRGDNLSQEIVPSLPKEPWRIHVSIKTKGTARILLCDKRNVDLRINCYIIELVGKHTGVPSLLRCQYGSVYSIIFSPDELHKYCSLVETDNTEVDVLKEDIWNHFTLNWNGSELSISLFGEDTPFLKWNEPDPFSLHDMDGRSLKGQRAFWKVHDYTYYETNASIILSTTFFGRNKVVCLLVLYRMLTTGNLEVQINGDLLYSPELKEDNKWHEARFKGNVRFRNGPFFEIKVLASLASIGLLRLCPPGGSTTVLSVSGASDVRSCALVGDPTQELKIDAVDGTECPGCKKACSAAGLSTSCKNTVFCFPTANHTQSCSCLEGYGGPNCTKLSVEAEGEDEAPEISSHHHLLLLLLLLLLLIPLLVFVYYWRRLARRRRREGYDNPRIYQEMLDWWRGDSSIGRRADYGPQRPFPRPPLDPLSFPDYYAQDDYTYIEPGAVAVVTPEDPEPPPLRNPPSDARDVTVHALSPAVSEDEDADVTASPPIAEKEATKAQSSAEKEVMECGDALSACHVSSLQANERTLSPSTATQRGEVTTSQPITAAVEVPAQTEISYATNDDAGP